MKKPPLKSGDVKPSHVLRDQYGMNALNRPEISVNVNDVPKDLQHLIVTVERWAIPCDVTRGDYFDQQPAEDIAQFWHSVQPFTDRINEWLDGLADDVSKWPEAAVHFMYFLKAHSEAWQPTPEEELAIEQRNKQSTRERNVKTAVEIANAAFGNKNYADVVAALEPFANDLDQVSAAKLNYARKRVG